MRTPVGSSRGLGAHRHDRRLLAAPSVTYNSTVITGEQEEESVLDAPGDPSARPGLSRVDRDELFRIDLATTPAPRPRTPGSLPHVRAFDGLRGLAVIVVLLYHLDVPWATGGFLGVTLFFVLSGFLITSLLLAGAERSERVDLRLFWSRRFRRLLPAAWAGIALAVVYCWMAGDVDQLRRLPGDVVSSLLDITNWRFLAASDSYTATYQSPSALLPYWSLAIEEQFYLIFPLGIALLIGRKAKNKAWYLTLGGLGLLSLVTTLVLFDPEHTSVVYYNTFARLGEMVAGVALAYALRGWWGRWVPSARRVPGGHQHPGATRHAVNVGTTVALVVSAVLWARVGTGDLWIYRGGMFVVAALSLALIVGAMSDGPVSKLLATRPLVAAGLISYGLYVYHWPIFLWLTPTRTGLSGWSLDIVRLAVTVGVALASYWFLEKPIRSGAWRFGPALRLAAVGSATAMVLGSLYLSGQANQRAVEAADSVSAPLVTQPPITSPAATSPVSKAPKAPPKKILFLGDSLLHQAYPVIAARFMSEGTEADKIGGPGQTLLQHQGAWVGLLEQKLAEWKPDVVVIESCCGHYQPDDPYLVGGQPVAIDSDAQWQAFGQVADQLVTIAERSAPVVMWALGPPAKTNGFYGPIEHRIDRVNAIAQQLTVTHPELGLIDWRVISGPDGSYADELPDAAGNLVPVRATDGLHFTPAGMNILADVTRRSVDQTWQNADDTMPRPAPRQAAAGVPASTASAPVPTTTAATTTTASAAS
jgi:peptidoglycan/LPS O-acetylase OafA/YrhL